VERRDEIDYPRDMYVNQVMIVNGEGKINHAMSNASRPAVITIKSLKTFSDL
jgi:hypothetical protein